jgi:radical SAM/Cys-rich protein
MNRFKQKLAEHELVLRRTTVQTLQINVGRKCNQACRHCHVDAAPWRTEMIDEPTARRIGEWIRSHKPPIVDITGGAPELSEFFRYFVETARGAGSHVIDRNNLTILEEPGFESLPEFLAANEVEVVASLPCYLPENVAKQRGAGIYEAQSPGIRNARRATQIESGLQPCRSVTARAASGAGS